MSKRPSQVHYIPPNRRRSAIESVSDIDRAPAASTTAPPRKAKPAPLLPGPFINTSSPSAQRERGTIASTTPAASTLLRTRTKQPTTTTETASPSASALGTTNIATRSRIRDSYASSTQQRIDALQSERSIPAPPSRASAHDRNMRSSHHYGRHDVGHGSHRVEVRESREGREVRESRERDRGSGIRSHMTPAGSIHSPKPHDILPTPAHRSSRNSHLRHTEDVLHSHSSPFLPKKIQSYGSAAVAPSPQFQILRRPRDVQDGHVSSSFALPPRPEPRYSTGKAGFVGDNIHQLTPSTTLEYRVSKFIDSLRPDIPDPPAEDAPYEYPYTQPCDPSSLPPPKRSQPADPRELKRVVLPVNPYATSGPLGGADPYFAVNPVKVRSSVAVQQGLDKGSSRRPRRVRGETRGRREYDEASSQGEECARRMYRLHT
ncbi:hypothetical protein FPQ18DRAFT_145481 [Pyronema domesticum]|uniref:Uncharacterized protein n=1 Tax=Pyronema omphalodes (strain CBS 100304) TaxID=1076935 RepID=U4L6X4_PYROM|nr:hypothetical protein FPQ18DRAFT_145481 [Pyronema domesticum]CCX12864.1 Protein of unknown function [Pyronema omphalodes CBS 100304]